MEGKEGRGGSKEVEAGRDPPGDGPWKLNPPPRHWISIKEKRIMMMITMEKIGGGGGGGGGGGRGGGRGGRREYQLKMMME